MKSKKKKLIENEKKKDQQLGKSKLKRVSNTWRNQSRILDKIGSPVISDYKERQYRFRVKLNDYWTNLHTN
jgi:hypothetical protein